MEIVKLYVIDVETAFHHQKVLLNNLNETQKEKAYRYKNEVDQIRSIASSYLMNTLSKEPIEFNKGGKPYYPNGPFFNVSHSGQYIVMAVSNKEIGIDIEENIEKNMTPLIRIFNEAEAKMLKEHTDFYYLWCAKESLIKCMGDTVSKVKEVPALPFNGLKTFKGKDYQCQTFIYDKHIVSVAREGKEEYEIKIEKLSRF